MLDFKCQILYVDQFEMNYGHFDMKRASFTISPETNEKSLAAETNKISKN